MNIWIAAVAVSIALASPAWAAGKCASPPKSQWQSEATLKAKLEGEGYKVSKIKVEGGCYEVYATDKAGKRANLAFNALTLEQLQDAEAGEK